MTHLPVAFFQNLGLPELVVILFIILLLFGAKRLPEMMRSLGKGVKEFKKGMKESGEGEEPEGSRKDDQKPPSP